MPINLADLQIYDHYLTTYQPNKSSKYDTHDYHKLKKIYSDIQWKNRFAPALLSDPSANDVSAAIVLKEQACEFQHTFSSLHVNNSGNMFIQQNPYSSNPALATVVCKSKNNEEESATISIQITSFATPQKNVGKYLLSNEETIFPSGNYSFDLFIKKKHYELQFGIPEEATNLQVQEKIKKLINKSNLGIEASIIQDTDNSNFTALQLESDSTGIPYQGDLHFDVSDDPAKTQVGIVSYLGLNDTILPPANAECLVNGSTISSYCNTLSIGQYEITLHPENIGQFNSDEILQIGMSPNLESMKQNIHTFIQGYNKFIGNLEAMHHKNTEHLQTIIQKVANTYQHQLKNCGITINSENQLEYLPPDFTSNDTFFDAEVINGLQSFGDAIQQKIDAAALDPLEYVNKSICFYRDPSTPYINPYVTSIYTGMLFQAYI